MANIEELKKIADENGVELTDDMVMAIAGGAYSKEEWDAMTIEEQKEAQRDSFMKMMRKLPCALQ